MNNFELFEFHPEEKKEWDAFVFSHPKGSIHQVSDWARFQKKIPGRSIVLGFGVRDKTSKKILATTFCVQMMTGVSDFFWWYSARGPVFDLDHKEAGVFLLNSVRSRLQKTPALFWRFDPYCTFEEWKSLCFSARLSTQNYQPTDTLEINLTQSEEDILANMKRKGRYNIQVARKKGIQIQVLKGNDITDTDIEDFYRLTTETTTRDKFSGQTQSYYKHFVSELSSFAVLFFAVTKDGHRIATALSTFCGPKAIYYFGASTSDVQFRNLMAPYLLQWSMIQYAQSQGCLTYDFLGIAPENDSKHAYAGISEFKWKFGGYRKTYISGREIIFRSVWYRIYRWVKWGKSFF